MTIAQLKKQLKVAQAEANKALAAEMELLALQQEIARESNPLVLALRREEKNNAKLDSILDFLETELDVVIRPVYGYGDTVSKIFTIARSVQFSKHDVKDSALSVAKVSAPMVENLLDAFGSTTYYGKESGEIEPAKPCDVELTAQYLDLVAQSIGLVQADLSKFNDKTVDYQYKSAFIRANQMKKNSDEQAQAEAEVEYED